MLKFHDFSSSSKFLPFLLKFVFQYSQEERETIITKTIDTLKTFKANQKLDWTMKIDEKTKQSQSFFISIPKEVITLNPLQYKRFFIDDQNKIQLFHSKTREKTFKLLLSLIDAKTKKILLSGPRG